MRDAEVAAPVHVSLSCVHAKTDETRAHQRPEVRTDSERRTSPPRHLWYCGQRFAIDLFSRVTELASTAGHRPASVLPMKKNEPVTKQRKPKIQHNIP
jgi:hypothetical protein